jgi:hypothetical protein
LIRGSYNKRVSLDKPITYFRNLPERKITPIVKQITTNLGKAEGDLSKKLQLYDLKPFRKPREGVVKVNKVQKSPKKISNVDEVLGGRQLYQLEQRTELLQKFRPTLKVFDLERVPLSKAILIGGISVKKYASNPITDFRSLEKSSQRFKPITSISQ